MNFKKALQAFLVTISCGMLNVAGAQQRPVFIPEDYVTEQAQADFVANGPKLLFSDSPETVYRNGILYRDKVEGDVRLFLHHVNGVAGKKKLAVILKNTDNLRPVHYKVTRSGAAGFAYDYMRDGKNSQKEYLMTETKSRRRASWALAVAASCSADAALFCRRISCTRQLLTCTLTSRLR
jgi:hypothetical protein